jgi:hypothetical protein
MEWWRAKHASWMSPAFILLQRQFKFSSRWSLCSHINLPLVVGKEKMVPVVQQHSRPRLRNLNWRRLAPARSFYSVNSVSLQFTMIAMVPQLITIRVSINLASVLMLGFAIAVCTRSKTRPKISFPTSASFALGQAAWWSPSIRTNCSGFTMSALWNSSLSSSSSSSNRYKVRVWINSSSWFLLICNSSTMPRLPPD